MKPPPPRCAGLFCAGLFLAALLPLSAPAGPPVAVTEVLTAPSSEDGEDFWELTNYGTNVVDLEELRFSDDSRLAAAHKLSELAAAAGEPAGLLPGESLVFARQARTIASPADFRAWWGEEPLAGRRVIVAPWGFGLNAGQDELQLWQVTATATNLLDHVRLGAADPGVTFVSDPVTGVFGAASVAGVHGAFRAAAGRDVGSPGTAGGPVPLQVIQAPADVDADTGATAIFGVVAHGLPRPRYQWRFGTNDLPGATESTLVLSNVTPAQAGAYTVRLANGRETLVTAPARLRVNDEPRCAAIVRPPADVEVFPGQTAVFRVEVRGYPPPQVQWRREGGILPGATNVVLEVPGATPADAGRYSVEVANPLCATNASARLSVVPPYRLRVTEAMTCPSDHAGLPGRNDWWELTNVDTRPVNLRGWHFDDSPGVLGGGYTVTNDVWLLPGRSAIFVSDMTAADFRRWWGETNLPPDLPIISYFGNGFGNHTKEIIALWNPAARHMTNFLLKFELRLCLEFPDPCPCGASRWYDPEDQDAWSYWNYSVPGEHGAFRAAESDDVGSPGWLSNDQRLGRPRLTAALRAAGVELAWTALPGRTYEVQRSDALPAAAWTVLGRVTAAGPTATYTDAPASATARFYRAMLLPAPP